MDCTSPLAAARGYAAMGWPDLPLHTPVPVSREYPSGCDCRRTCEDQGKHPRTLHGVKDSSVDPTQIEKWWTMFPKANVGIDLAGAGLLDIAPDSPVWHAEFIARGLPKTLTFASGGGDGHLHFLYKLPEGAPQTRSCHPDEYDILSAGYAVMPPSLHKSGQAYLWIRDDVPLAEAPHWAVAVLSERPKGRVAPVDPGEITRDEAFNDLLRSVDMRAWEGTLFESDRSKGLVAIAGELAKAGANEATIVFWLQERDDSLGWHKYSDRTDREVRYAELAEQALERAANETQRVGQASRARAAVSGINAPPLTTEPEVEWATPTDPYDGWPSPLHSSAFYGPLGEFILDISSQTEADPAAIYAECLSGLSASFSPLTYMRAANAPHPSRVSTVLIGATGGGRKGTASRIVENLLGTVDPLMKDHIAEGLSSGEGLIWAVRDPIMALDKKTKQLAVVDAGVDDKRLLVIESEFGSTLRVLQREGNSLSGIVRRAWDLAPTAVLQSLTKNSQAKSTGAHIVITGHVTRQELLKYIDRTDLVNGFANRFLWFASRRQRDMADGEEVDSSRMMQFGYVASAAMDWSQLGHRMQWSPEAHELWLKAYPRLAGERFGLYGGITARAAPYVLRVAVLLSTLDRDNVISLGALKAAIAVNDYCERTAKWIFGEIMGDEIADDILIMLRTEGKLTRTQIYDGLGRNTRKAAITRALDLLLQSGLAQTGKMPSGGGRPIEVWTAVQVT